MSSTKSGVGKVEKDDVEVGEVNVEKGDDVEVGDDVKGPDLINPCDIDPDVIFRDDSKEYSFETISSTPWPNEDAENIARKQQKIDDGEEFTSSYETDPKWRRFKERRRKGLGSSEDEEEACLYKRSKKD